MRFCSSDNIDDMLKRLLDLAVSGTISDAEYKEKKAQLVNRKFDILNGGSSDEEWLERIKEFLSLAHQAKSSRQFFQLIKGVLAFSAQGIKFLY